jgi:hypothetical protein
MPRPEHNMREAWVMMMTPGRRWWVPLLALGLGLAARVASAEVRQEGPNWTVDNGTIRVRLEPESAPEQAARLEVTDTRSGLTLRSTDDAHWRVKGVRAEGEAGLTLDVEGWSNGGPRPLTVHLALDGADLTIRVEGDPTATIDRITAFPPLLIVGRSTAMAVADYSNGHLYPLDLEGFPAQWLDGGRMDMPWVGLLDQTTGAGVGLILETPDDAVVETRPRTQADGSKPRAMAVLWEAIHGTWAAPRSVVLRFTPTGGYVALAKAYRAYAKDHGLLVTLADKVAKNPNVAKLFGATDVWGGSLGFAREAKAAGLDRLIVHGRHRPADVKAIENLGYLVAQYDNYTDVEPLKSPSDPVDSNHDRVPESVVQKADGSRMTAWLTYDGKTQFMKRCPALWLAAAKVVVPRSLAERADTGRFIDVTTAEALYECFDPAHPLTRAQKRQAGVDLLSYVRSQNLVVGGEHGVWWAVPQVDYFEGLMSHNPSFAWPAGHLVRPKNRTESYAVKTSTWDHYDRDGIGVETRVPLWELVFHDCVVTTWYWGDSSDFLDAVDPAYQARKDAFNVLYGTMPMLWAGEEGTWTTHRDRFLRTARQVGDVTRTVATAEMVGHEWVTPDRQVQRSAFANGVEAVANFGPEPREVELQGRRATLPQYGYLVRGPGVDILGPAGP